MDHNGLGIRELIEIHGQPPIAGIATVFGVSRERVYKIAKTPIRGKVFEHKEFNWEAIERFILRRLDPDIGLDTLETIIIKANALRVQRSVGTGFYANKNRDIIDGKDVPPLRDHIFKMPEVLLTSLPTFKACGIPLEHPCVHPVSGAPIVMFKGDTKVYTFVYQTRSYTILRELDKNGVFANNDLRKVSNLYMNMNGLDSGLATIAEVNRRHEHNELPSL